jgi:hypothetical protein
MDQPTDTNDPVDLYLTRLNKMTDQQIMDECVYHGRVMEHGFKNRDQKVRAKQAFEAAAARPNLASEREMLLTACRVLRLL